MSEIERLRKENSEKDDRIDDLLERLDSLAVAYQQQLLNQNKDKSICCNENTIRYSSVGVNNDVDTHYTCTNCGIIKTKRR